MTDENQYPLDTPNDDEEASVSSKPTLPRPSLSTKTRGHIFMSYSSKDRAFVDRLAEDLRAHGHTVWIDFEGIRGGEQWKQSIADGLHASRVVLLIVSPDSIASKWVEAEVETARQLEKTIIPLLLRPIDDVKALPQPNSRYVLTDIHYRDFTHGYQQAFEQLLKDLPQPESGVPGHCQKLIARLAALPWGLDHYMQEEAKLLPVDASPYEDGVIKGNPENLLRRLWNGERLLVLGEPGIGKTVALERLAWELANRTPPVLPVLVKLLEYDGQPLLEWIRLSLISLGEIRLKDLDETRRFLETVPFEVYFLLDGLNEVRPAYRDQIVSELTRLGLEYPPPRYRLVVTSRVQDESWRRLRQGSALTESYLVQAVRDEEIQSFLTAHLGEEQGRALWAQLDRRMRELAAVPLLLWLIKEAWLHASQSRVTIRVPDNRGALYTAFIERMLRRDDERQSGGTIYSQAVRLQALEKLALVMHEQQSLTIVYDAAVAQAGESDLLKALLASGLLIGERELRFAPHQTVQEHFAARALKDGLMQQVKGGAFNQLRRQWLGRGELKYANDPWWSETFIQLAGLVDDSDALVLGIAETNPWLALWCIQEGKQVREATRNQIAKRSEALIASADPSDRRRAAQALARLETTRVKEPLARLSIDTDAPTARVALQALHRLGEEGQSAFESVLLTSFAEKPPKERAAWGRAIADIDPRPGVSAPNGLPQLEWRNVPPDNSGKTFTFGTGDDAQQLAITYPYWIAKYPVTIAQFLPFVDGDGYTNNAYWTDAGRAWRNQNNIRQPDNWNDPRWHLANHPVIGVSFYEAYAYTRWLDAQLKASGIWSGEWPEGWQITLLTSAEWEKAARYPDGRMYPWGEDYQAGYANINETVGGAGPSYLARTSAVGIYPQGRNPALDTYDQSGNVWEWCLKWHPKDNDPEAVVRGGSWSYNRFLARGSSRYSVNPDDRSINYGFRVAARSPSRDSLVSRGV
jgi:formylglycine-generating enzyme required for sulfatase activity